MLRTQVGIVGAGPAGLLLSLMLQRRGVESVIVEARGREAIEATIRAGILEQSTVDLMAELGVADRLRREGAVHEGTLLRFGGRNHRIDFKYLTGGRVATLYPQHEVLKDLIAARLDRGGQILFGHKATEVVEVETAQPVIRFAGLDGVAQELRCDVVVGADGSYGASRPAIPQDKRQDYLRIYPFGWFGILCEAPPSAEELVYARHERGFALISSRTPEVQRMYFQCDPDDRAENWSEDRIWAELQARVAGEDGFRLKEGRIFQKNIVPMRSFVCEPMQHGRLFIAGDAAHTVPPTGAKGMNLAMADIFVLDRALGRFYAGGSSDLLDAYSATALRRVWRAQHFSWWMTSMLHRFEGASEFDEKRQLAELDLVTGTVPAATSLAQNYVGMPFGS
jgi:p-hydroxybenzoate 3-monooxygenase